MRGWHGLGSEGDINEEVGVGSCVYTLTELGRKVRSLVWSVKIGRAHV